ncbi:conjugal transfer mating pair stabilization protein TraN [Pseudomonas sp. 2FE]|uniref:conjugal transfer mating pair stabilization protein TraN n=1 Tax=Pseudomonas sp. 2FE TaxID=2502190 RepID=UPI0010F47380|nr:conjugal transfer mating pair stabilization protein TraN [Pseudomonas sp. 2FE]
MRHSTKTALKRVATAAMIAFYLNSMTFNAWADAVSTGSAAGQEVGSYGVSVFNGEAGSTTLQDLFPATEGTTSLEEVYGDDNKTIDIGINANTRLQAEESREGDAYRTLVESNKRTSVDLSKDPMLNQADKVREPTFMDGFKENFADCTRTEVFETIKRDAHVAKYETCERVTDQGGNVNFNHDYKIGVVEYLSGEPNFQSCGVGCMYLWIGDVVDNNLGGWCNVYEKYVRYRVINKEAITSAKIDFIQWDDFAEIYLNDTRVWLNPVGFFPENQSQLPAGFSCEYVGNLGGTGTLQGGGVDITSQFKGEGDVQTLKMRVSVGNRGEIYARIKILYDPAKAIVDNGWGPSERLPMFDMVNDGFCKNVSMSCTEMPVVDANGCTSENGVRVCRSDMKPSPTPSIDPFCKKANVTAECSFYKGDLKCYKDPTGKEHCPTNNGGVLDSCKEKEADPNCGFISQACIKGAEGDSGSCYAFSEVWDCGYDTSYETIVNTGADIDCPGGARCMGSECFDTSNVKSGDFAYAAAMLQVAQFAEHDLACGGDGSSIEVSNSCKVFKGEAMECKKALGGYVDCCEAPEGVSILDYVNLTMNTLKMTSSIEALNRTGSLFGPGYWEAASNAVTTGASTLIKGEWSNVYGNASGAFTDTLAGEFVSQLQQQLMQWAYDAMVEAGATGAANTVFAVGADGAVSGLGSQVAMVVNIIGWVYMVYVIVDLLINIIWECEEKEFELGAKNATRQCSLVGTYCASESAFGCVEMRESYCCYGSVVGRIVQESAREQLGISYGDVKSPSCEGLTPDELQQVDWDKVDLSEWIGMLNLAGRLPTPTTVGIDNLTGTGSQLGEIFNEGTDRANTLDRNIERLQDVDIDKIKKQAEEELR